MAKKGWHSKALCAEDRVAPATRRRTVRWIVRSFSMLFVNRSI